MRIDSCRKCGEKLETLKNCLECNVPTTLQCVQCNFVTDEQLHFQCDVPLLLKVKVGRR